MSKRFFLVSLVFSTFLLVTSCDKDDPIIVDPPELITTVNYTLVPAGGGAEVVLSFIDLDGDGGVEPTITGGTLAANETYAGTLELLNESESPAENITEEVQEEDEDHQFFFQSTISDLSVIYTDQDADGNPVGLSTTLNTGAAGTGILTVILKHKPDKSGTGVAAGDIENAGGETDIEIRFPIDVQ